MAEVVQLHIEELLPGFKCLEEEGVFTSDEIQTVIKNIQNHEYRLQRSIKEKENGLKYINYLQCVLKLIQKKYDQMNVTVNEDVRHLLIKKIKTEFRKLRDRHQRDVKIWMSFINFCKRNNHKDYVGKIYNRMLQVLPDRPELWISAAKWFLEGQNSWDNARKTFQKGLRSNKESPNVYMLYVEFFRFELLFIEIILKRKKMLSEEENNDIDQNDPLYDHLPESQIENDNIMSGKIAMAVFKEAIKNIGIEYVIRFLDVLEDFSSYSFSKDLKSEILDFMKANYSDREETCDILCRMCTSEENSIKRFKIMDQEYKNTLEKFSNERMWSLYLDCLVNNLKSNSNSKDKQFFANKLDSELNNCFKENLISKSTFIHLIEKLDNLQCSPGYLQRIVKYGLEKWENELDIWNFHFKIQIRNNATKAEIKNLFNKVLKIMSNISQLENDGDCRKKCIDLIRIFVDWAINNLSERELIKTLETNCTINASMKDLSLSRQMASYFKPIFLEQISNSTNGQIWRRQMYDKYKLMNPIVKEFFLKMLELEINDLKQTGNKESDIKYVRKVYNEMLSQFGKDDHNLWLDFCEFELKFGSYTEISRLYEIAKKQLNPKESDLFVQNYSLLGKKLGF